MNITIVNLNNKIRKGTYIYIKEKGLPGRYYKYTVGDLIDGYKQHYYDKYIKHNVKGTIHQYRKSFDQYAEGQKPIKQVIPKATRDYLAKLKKRPRIIKAIKAGMTKAYIRDVRNSGNTELKKAKRKLLEPLVLDKGLIDLLIKDENFKKLKHRLEYQFIAYGRKNQRRIEGNTFNKTPEEALDNIRKSIRNGEDTLMTNYIRKFKFYAWKNLNIKSKGKVERTDLLIIFRKGK